MWDIVDELKSSPKSHIAVLKMVAAFRKWFSNWFAFCQFSFDRKISRIQCTKVWKKKLNDVNGFFVPLNMAISTNLASYKNKYQNRQRKESRKIPCLRAHQTPIAHNIYLFIFRRGQSNFSRLPIGLSIIWGKCSKRNVSNFKNYYKSVNNSGPYVTNWLAMWSAYCVSAFRGR